MFLSKNKLLNKINKALTRDLQFYIMNIFKFNKFKKHLNYNLYLDYFKIL